MHGGSFSDAMVMPYHKSAEVLVCSCDLHGCETPKSWEQLLLLVLSEQMHCLTLKNEEKTSEQMALSCIQLEAPAAGRQIRF